MRVVGVDLSLTATGIATADGLTTIHTRPEGRSIAARLNRLTSVVNEAWSRIEPGPALVFVEGPSYHSVGSATHDLAGLWWLFMDRLSLWGWDAREVPPGALKKFATGKGTATKADMRMALFQRAGFDSRDDNQVDAWWLRQVGLHLLGDPDAVKLPKDHLTALAKIDTKELTT